MPQFGPLLNPHGRFQPVNNRQVDVHQDQVRHFAGCHRHPGNPVDSLNHFITPNVEHLAHQTHILGIILYVEYSYSHDTLNPLLRFVTLLLS